MKDQKLDQVIAEQTVPFNPDDRSAGSLLAAGIDQGHTYPEIVKGLNVISFGVYNCDQIYRLKERVIINPEFVNSEGAIIENQYVLSMINLDYNGAFSFYPSRFLCDASGKTVLALFTKGGNLYLINAEDFKALNISSSGSYTIAMTDMSDKITSSEELAEYLGIEI